MPEPTFNQVNVLVEAQDTEALCAALALSNVTYENAGSQRGAAETSELIILAAPTVVVLALVLEKLRRLRLPRTYLRPTADGLDVWTDSTMPDGRVIVVHEDGRVDELPDPEISMQTLKRLLSAGE